MTNYTDEMKSVYKRSMLYTVCVTIAVAMAYLLEPATIFVLNHTTSDPQKHWDKINTKIVQVGEFLYGPVDE